MCFPEDVVTESCSSTGDSHELQGLYRTEARIRLVTARVIMLPTQCNSKWGPWDERTPRPSPLGKQNNSLNAHMHETLCCRKRNSSKEPSPVGVRQFWYRISKAWEVRRREKGKWKHFFLVPSSETVLQWENAQTAQHKQLCLKGSTLQS